ncbi:pumilio homolog 4 [Coffea arabica]|uniref:Pumilio homolog 4 n=1 Tax=Coffea arabica TaxID=13443 RepID=A0A6P6WBM9_COFAR
MVDEGGKDDCLLSSGRLMSDSGDDLMLGGSSCNGDLMNNSSILESELELLLLQKEQQRQRNRDLFVGSARDFDIHRSGSAPPSVEGALSAAGSLSRNPNFASLHSTASNTGTDRVLTEEEIRSHPAYLAYYYSNENLNPRLPPPLLSKEDWRIAQRVQAAGSSVDGTGDLTNNLLVDDGVSSLLLSMQPRLAVKKAEEDLIELRKAAVRNLSRKSSTEYLEGSSSSSVGLSKAGMGARRKSFADIVQEGCGQPATSSGRLSRSASRNSVGDILDSRTISDTYSGVLQNRAESFDSMHRGQLTAGLSRDLGHPSAYPCTTGASLTSPPGFPAVGSRVSLDAKKNIRDPKSQDLSSHDTEIYHILASFPGLTVNKVSEDAPLSSPTPNCHQLNMQQHFIDKSRAEKLIPATNHNEFSRGKMVSQLDYGNFNLDRQVNLPRRASSLVNLQSLVNSSEFTMLDNPNLQYPGSHLGNVTLNGQSLRRSGNLGLSNIHSPDIHQAHYSEKQLNYATHAAAMPRNLSHTRNYTSTSHPDLHQLERIYIETLLAQQNQHCQLPLLSKSGSLNLQYHGIPTFGLHMSHQGNRMPNAIHPTVESGGPTFQNEQPSQFTIALKSQLGGASGTRIEGKTISPLLEELKSNKGRSLELSDVLDHVVEFSMDQYGSRFIQQKLETACTEDKITIFPKIIPHARSLMTDVFGNYVIQKFFEHGTETQRKELADQLVGHVLGLSLQMYGCRVIQKALEVVDVEQQTRMVTELNGSVMKCVRDQNGNHVIQKCIECVPQDRIQFIISSFFGQVVALSTHPYGCRVIQRVLEHCNDPNTQHFIIDEIMNSICTLAQDQYGNYVIQHVLQHGNPRERSEVISKLAGQIVKMSQQKFASNVIEKCLAFGGPQERKVLIDEMLGSTDENEPLQAMMKDPFGNYVVQKVLETCDDQSRGLIVSRIKVHLNALKKYTYGKHIVSRVEKLIATGEKHMAVSSS